MHMRWSSLTYDPVDGTTPVPGGRSPDYDISTKWDSPNYDYLGDFYSSHVNPVFWRLHGWVDDRIEAWFAAHQKAHHGQIVRRNIDGVSWFEQGRWVLVNDPWSGPAMMAHMVAEVRMKRGKRMMSTPAHQDEIKKMEKVVAILFGPADSARRVVSVPRFTAGRVITTRVLKSPQMVNGRPIDAA